VPSAEVTPGLVFVRVLVVVLAHAAQPW